MTNVTSLETVQQDRPSVLATVAGQYGMDRQAFEMTLRATVFPKDGSREHLAAFLLVAKQYNLNPVTKEIYAFPTKGGGIQPIVSIDGWMNLMNSHPQMDGLEFEDIHDKKGEKITAIKCRVFRKDRSKPVEIIEYMEECKRNTEPWVKWPARMLRHKAAIQAARYAFGFAGIIDPDEWERSPENPANGGAARAMSPPSPPPASAIEHQPVQTAVPSTPEVREQMVASPQAPADIKQRMDAGPIPEFLDRRGKSEPEVSEAEIVDPADTLKEADGAFATAQDIETLSILYEEFKDRLDFPPDLEALYEAMKRHEKRLERETP